MAHRWILSNLHPASEVLPASLPQSEGTESHPQLQSDTQIILFPLYVAQSSAHGIPSIYHVNTLFIYLFIYFVYLLTTCLIIMYLFIVYI